MTISAWFTKDHRSENENEMIYFSRFTGKMNANEMMNHFDG
jgi:hypothetical protein